MNSAPFHIEGGCSTLYSVDFWGKGWYICENENIYGVCSMKKEYSILKKEALTALSSYMDSLGENQGSKLAYWISDYVRFLKREPGFDPKKLIRYKRGAIVKVHLGYRVGSEEGGLHYAVVMDVDNKLSNPVATVIPLTSIKPDTDLDHLHSSKVFLGDEIFVKLLEELKEYQKQTLCLQEDILTQQKALLAQKVDQKDENYEMLSAKRRLQLESINIQIESMKERAARCKKMLQEVQKMKQGSIALVGQITTVSKLRIYDPLYPSDVLSNIRLSSDSLEKLDTKLKALYTYQK